MSGLPRDLLKTKEARIAEVMQLLAYKAGQANSQLVYDGGDLAVGTTTTKFAINETDYVLGQALRNKNAQDEIVVDVGSATGVGQFRKVLVELQTDGTVVQVVGAIAGSQATAVLPAPDPARVSVGWIEIPASFVPATTVVTVGMLKKMPYFGQ